MGSLEFLAYNLALEKFFQPGFLRLMLFTFRPDLPLANLFRLRVYAVCMDIMIGDIRKLKAQSDSISRAMPFTVA
jgi:hypothetical protein